MSACVCSGIWNAYGFCLRITVAHVECNGLTESGTGVWGLGLGSRSVPVEGWRQGVGLQVPELRIEAFGIRRSGLGVQASAVDSDLCYGSGPAKFWNQGSGYQRPPR